MSKISFIVAKDETNFPELAPDNIVYLDSDYEIWYYDSQRLTDLSVEKYTYSAIPKCLGLLSEQALEVSGIIRLQQQPTLSLKGQGVLVAVIDTGIQIQDRAFRREDGGSRIRFLWDQTRPGIPPEGYINGSEYTQKELDSILLQNDEAYQSAVPGSENGKNIEMSKEMSRDLPGKDEEGHGSFLASVVAGTPDEIADFTGALPLSELIVVKLRPAPEGLRNFYYISQEVPAYSEADIMEAVNYVVQKARELEQPLVVFLGLGCNNGQHNGDAPICRFLDRVAATRKHAVVVAAGNEGNKQIHFRGRSTSILEPVIIEINVEKDMEGFYGEFWGNSLERYAVAVASPSGERLPKSKPVSGDSRIYYFNYEDTTVTVDYRYPGREKRAQLIFLRFSRVKVGIWRLYVYSDNLTKSDFNIWLPLSSHQNSSVRFLAPDPDCTITMPADANVVTSVGGYRVEDRAVMLESGRGFLPNGMVKPDFVAPAVNIEGKGLRGQYVTFDGTSAAAAITAGACGQFLEWAVIKRGINEINSVDIKNQLIRGCERSNNIEYPNPLEGYGQLNIYTSFRLL